MTKKSNKNGLGRALIKDRMQKVFHAVYAIVDRIIHKKINNIKSRLSYIGELYREYKLRILVIIR